MALVNSSVHYTLGPVRAVYNFEGSLHRTRVYYRDSEGQCELPEGFYSAGYALRVADVIWSSLPWLPRQVHNRLHEPSDPRERQDQQTG
jgi:hypothetical protein